VLDEGDSASAGICGGAQQSGDEAGEERARGRRQSANGRKRCGCGRVWKEVEYYLAAAKASTAPAPTGAPAEYVVEIVQ